MRSIFLDAVKVLAKNQDKFRYDAVLLPVPRSPSVHTNTDSFMFDKIMPLADAVEGYDLFDKMKVQKVVFTP